MIYDIVGLAMTQSESPSVSQSSQYYSVPSSSIILSDSRVALNSSKIEIKEIPLVDIDESEKKMRG
jgi:hypothetical protein